jgi:L-alanine-DL-glutamate epimerase-like enolase superfamily enzyme
MQQRSSTNDTILNRIREGMSVYDLSGEKVGTVREVYFGTGAGFEATPQTAHDPDTGMDNGNPIYTVLESIFGSDDDLPDTLRNRMFHDGFIRINTDGIFASDRYALTEQISEALGDDVQLTVNYDELLKG